MGFLTNLVREKAKKQFDETISEGDKLRFLIENHPDPEMKGRSAEALVKHSGLSAKEGQNLLALMTHLSSSIGQGGEQQVSDTGGPPMLSKVAGPEASTTEELPPVAPPAGPSGGGFVPLPSTTYGQATPRPIPEGARPTGDWLAGEYESANPGGGQVPLQPRGDPGLERMATPTATPPREKGPGFFGSLGRIGLETLAGGLSQGLTVREQLQREAETRQAETRRKELEQQAGLRREEMGYESQLRTQEAVNPQVRQARIDDAVNSYVRQRQAEEKLNDIQAGKLKVKYKNYIQEEMGKLRPGESDDDAYRRATMKINAETGKAAFYPPPTPLRGDRFAVPDDPANRQGGWHWMERVGATAVPVIDETTGRPLAAPIPASEKPPLAPANVRSALWVQSHLADPDPQVRAAAKQLNDRANAAIQAAATQALDPETLRFLAERSLITGNDPTFGFGTAASKNRTQFFMAQAQLARESGNTTAELIANQNMAKAARQDLPRMQLLLSQTRVNEGAAEGYFNLLTKEAGPRMDAESWSLAVPALDSWIRTGVVKATGNPAVNNYLTGLTEALTEYAKVVAGQTTGAAVTQEANRQAQGLIDRGLSTESVNDWVEHIAKPFMKKRETEYQEEINNLRQISGQVGGVGQGRAPVTPGGDGTAPKTAEELLKALGR